MLPVSATSHPKTRWPVLEAIQLQGAQCQMSKQTKSSMHAQGTSLPAYVGDHHASLWLIGPFFAAITGLAFKEGICYGKFECAGLFFVSLSNPALASGPPFPSPGRAAPPLFGN